MQRLLHVIFTHGGPKIGINRFVRVTLVSARIFLSNTGVDFLKQQSHLAV